MDPRTTATHIRSAPRDGFPDDGARQERRSQLRDRMRIARIQLAGAHAPDLSFKLELLTLYVRNQIGAALALPVMAVIVATSSLVWVPWSQATAWLSAIFLGQGISIALCQKFERLDHDRIDVDDWGNRLAAAEFFCAIAWATLIFMFWDATHAVERIYLIAVLMVVASIKMAISSNFLAVVYAATVPITAAVTIRCLVDGGTLYLSMAIMAICAQVYFIQLARKLNQTALRMLEFRAEKDALIAELEEAKSKSDEARHRAEDANIAKSRFLATISHELRTPLNAILGFSEVMKEEIMGPHQIPAYKDYAGDIHRSGEHLLNLISELLDISRIEAGRYELNEEPVRIDRIADDCHALLKLRAQEGGIRITEAFEPDLPAVQADQRAVRQIWLNLISNAIKFTPYGGEVVLSVSRTRTGGIAMSVRDTGPGIPQEEIPTVLSTFGQGSLAHRKAERGAGLGLPIVQGLAKLHDCTFELKSKLRAGTEAIIVFPRSRVLAARAGLVPPVRASAAG